MISSLLLGLSFVARGWGGCWGCLTGLSFFFSLLAGLVPGCEGELSTLSWLPAGVEFCTRRALARPVKLDASKTLHYLIYG